MSESPKPSFYEHMITVLASDIDANQHVSNISYLQWMLDAAISHSDTVGCTEATHARGATWIIRSHHIDYLKPAYLDDDIVVRTWISDFGRIRCTRTYEIVSSSGSTLHATGETVWVFLDAESGRPQAIPERIMDLFGQGL